MPTGKLAKWQMLLSEFDIVYMTEKEIKAQALADHLAENPRDEEYEALKTYFHDEEVSFVGEIFLKRTQVGDYSSMERRITRVKVLEQSWFRKIEFKHTPRIQNELADALATIASMVKHVDTDYIDPMDIDLKEHPVHCSHVESQPDGLPWYFDIKRYLESGTYTEDATSNQKKSIRRMALNFFLNGEVLYRRTPNLGLLRCVDAAEAVRLIENIHAGVCGTHMNGLTLARKILRTGYFWMTMENDYCKFVQKCHKCQVQRDLI
ncbi:uncharacterized protein [Solanum lycopersicum]|uniref:uncharacterized protein n=1 Tax=Solanum lycopersicum TaxID=4081 RepID=UPI003749C2CD